MINDLYDFWTSLPAVITEYDPSTQEASVKPLAKIRYKDNSQDEFPIIDNVPVICPSTAFAALQFPVRVGDKVLLMFQSRDVSWTLSDMDTSGLDYPDFNTIRNDTGRVNELSDCVAIIGFSSFVSPHTTSDDLYMFNNSDDDSKKNEIVLKEDGEIEIKNAKTSVNMTPSGDIDVKADDTISMDANSINMTASDITMSADTVSITAETSITGNTSITGAVAIEGNVVVQGVVYAKDFERL
jgi:hypothetical protein